MDGKALLTERLDDWARANRINLAWMNETLRLEDQDGTARAAVAFPRNYWEIFSQLKRERQEAATDAVVLRIHLMHDSEWVGSYAKAIHVPLSYVMYGEQDE